MDKSRASKLLSIIFLFCSFLFINRAEAQYQFKGYTYLSDNKIKPGVSIGYWNRLTKYRVEFYPSVFADVFQENNKQNSFQAGIEVGTRFYFLDFRNGCDCPVFSKDGRNIMKAIFLELNPGLGYSFDLKEIALKTGIGAGYDFGLSDLITISPIIGGSFFFQNSATPFLPQLSVSVVFRPDYVKKWH